MAGSVNKVILIGNLGKDPETRTTQDGGKIVSMTIATSENWKDRATGERKERTEWHRVVIFNPNLADIAEKYLKKGSSVYLEGALQTRKWTDQQGVEKYTTEVVLSRFGGNLTLLGGRPSDGGSYGASSYDEPHQQAERKPAASPNQNRDGGWEAPSDMDDEIPF